MEMKSPQLIVELIGVSKQFGGVHALKRVDLALYAGEVHALVGENGAGKSTLVKMLAGVHTPDEGIIKFAGDQIELRNPAQAKHRGIAVIQQHPSLFPDLDVAENIFMGRHPLDRLGRVDWRRMYDEVDKLFASLHVQFSSHDPISSLSIAHQQLVEIAKALSLQARVLVMDEPTAALSAREIEELFTIVRHLREQGVAILFISHRLDEIFTLADRITVFRDGSHIVTASASALTPEEVVQHMVGRTLEALFPKEEASIGEVVLQVEHLTRRGAFRDVSFTVRRGEILGFAGLIGAGRTEVARVLFGVDRAEAGRILINGRVVHIHSPSAAMRHGLAYVPEDRQQHGLILNFAIAPNMTLPIMRQMSNVTLINRVQERRIATDYARRLQVRSSGIDQLAQLLSGGNQQKVVLSKWLATNPSVLILDEPTRGIDVGAKAEVHRIISRLATEGMAIILISSELPEILGMSDRILVMHEGRVTSLLDRSEANQEKVMFAATGQVKNNERN